MPARDGDTGCTVAGVRKPSMKETAIGRTLAVRLALWGFACRG